MNKNKKIYIALLIGIVAVSFSFQSRFFEIAKQIEIYNTVFKTININYIDEINPAEITKNAINHTLENLDPYTRFYNEQQMEEARIRREGEYGGIGISSFYTYNGIVVAAVKEGFSADKAGLKPGDIIIEVNNQVLKGLENDELSQMLKGTPETPVNLTINRNNTVFKVDLKLDKVIVDPVPFFDMVNETTGYIKLTQFTSGKATENVKNAFFSLKEKGMEKLIFDLRSNPGGSLSDAVNITNIFIPKGKKVVDTKGKIKANSRTYKTSNDGLDIEIPIVVLIDDRSASASEIVSGALQDYDRAVVMGQRSFGKGLVQRFYTLSYGTQMKATISKYYTPSGRCIQELDYASRDLKTGEVPKFSDNIVNEFSTENGRKVYDGGGVTPDVLIQLSEKTEETESLLKSRAIFNYATNYVKKNPLDNFDGFSFTSTDFSDFTSYLINKDTSFVTPQEKLFKEAYETVENSNSINNDYTNIVNTLKQQKVASITKNIDVILPKIEDEIIEQLFYEKGLYTYYLKHDTTIQKAAALLNNPKEYNKILAK